MRKFNNTREIDTAYDRLRMTGSHDYKYIKLAHNIISAMAQVKECPTSQDEIVNIGNSIYEVLVPWAETGRLTEIMDDLTRKQQLEKEKHIMPEYMYYYRMYHRVRMLRNIKSNLKNK
ncbi:MAG: hypothetical protein ABR974_05130 [Bacteroidales bacterium]|jgi:hypothetical protein